MDIFKLGDKILALLEMVFGFWNNQISLVFAMLGQSPVDFKGGDPWAAIEAINPIFVAVGSSLVVLFFVIGFCSESVDIKEEMRFEVILRMLIKLALAEWFVANNVTIMKAFFTTIGKLVNALTAGTSTTLAINSTQADIIKDLGFGESLIMLILAALLSVIIIICGFFMIYNVYFRFLKLLVIVPMGSIAFSTMGGNRTVSHTAVTYRAITSYEHEVELLKNNKGSRQERIKAFKKFENITELDRAAVIALVKQVRVYGKDRIEVIFNFQEETERHSSLIAFASPNYDYVEGMVV